MGDVRAAGSVSRERQGGFRRPHRPSGARGENAECAESARRELEAKKTRARISSSAQSEIKSGDGLSCRPGDRWSVPPMSARQPAALGRAKARGARASNTWEATQGCVLCVWVRVRGS